MIGRGYKLVCKVCNVPLQKGDLIESKPSKYQNWECDRCQVISKSGISRPFSTKRKPKARVPTTMERSLPKCWRCGGPMHYVGRKFYHGDCYDSLHTLVVTSTTTTTITPPPKKVLENG